MGQQVLDRPREQAPSAPASTSEAGTNRPYRGLWVAGIAAAVVILVVVAVARFSGGAPGEETAAPTHTGGQGVHRAEEALQAPERSVPTLPDQVAEVRAEKELMRASGA